MEIEPMNDGQVALAVVVGIVFWSLFFVFNFGF
jgi:hypothetical protein